MGSMTSALPGRVAQKTGCCRICLLQRHSGSQLLHRCQIGEDSEDEVDITTDSENEVDDTTGVENDVDVPTALMTSSTLEPDAVNVMDATWWGSQQPFGRCLGKTALSRWTMIVLHGPWPTKMWQCAPTGRLSELHVSSCKPRSGTYLVKLRDHVPAHTEIMLLSNDLVHCFH